MKDEYDFTDGRPASEVEHLQKLRAGKTRISIMIDNDLLDAFRERAEKIGMGYQTLINQALRDYVEHHGPPVDEATLRRVIREELKEES